MINTYYKCFCLIGVCPLNQSLMGDYKGDIIYMFTIIYMFIIDKTLSGRPEDTLMMISEIYIYICT